MSLDLHIIQNALARHGPIIRVVVAQVKGSTPREIGASMLVWADGQEGTIGGGELEWQACKQARDMLISGKKQHLNRVSLGPSIGQCCGGSVTLLSETFDVKTLDSIDNDELFCRPTGKNINMPLSVSRTLTMARSQGIAPPIGFIDTWMIEPVSPAPVPLWIFGAGHVGRALVGVITKLPDFVITWIDTTPERFPAQPPSGVNILPAKAPPRALRAAPKNAHHLILTYSHALDLELCHAGLNHGFSSFGLIGSATKWARFRRRLVALGNENHKIDQITCPIGDTSLGKHPEAIALGVATKLIKTVQQARNNDRETSNDRERKRG